MHHYILDVDDGEHSASTVVTAIVIAPDDTMNYAPNAVGYPEFPNGNVGPTTVVLRGGESSDPEGEMLQYQWRLVDGTNLGNNVDATMNNVAPGNYTAILTVTDPVGNTDVSVLVDGEYPLVNIINPENKTYNNGSLILVDYFIFESSLDSVWYSLNYQYSLISC